MLRIVFLFWYVIGLLLMLTVGVPAPLAFSNGLFLVFFALYAIDIEGRMGERAGSRWLRVAVVGLFTFGVEWLSVKTGWPFGSYNYSSILGIQLGGVPLTIACAWVGVLLSAIMLAQGQSRWIRALQAGIWTVAFDLVLDPVAFARGFWTWEGEGLYFGVPLTNFIAWFILSAGLSLMFPTRLVPHKVRKEAVRLSQLMLLMFGILGLKEGMFVPMIVAVVATAAAEGTVMRYDTSSQKQAV